MKRAIFPGTFDPFTCGHASLVERSISLFDELIIGVGINESKNTMLTETQRVKALRELYSDRPNIKVEAYRGLTIDFAQEVGAQFILRGVRSTKDFEYELSLADINRQLSGIETLLLLTEPQYAALSSSVVRELVRYGKDISEFLPEGYTF